jgi:hypothetical protein
MIRGGSGTRPYESHKGWKRFLSRGGCVAAKGVPDVRTWGRGVAKDELGEHMSERGVAKDALGEHTSERGAAKGGPDVRTSERLGLARQGTKPR